MGKGMEGMNGVSNAEFAAWVHKKKASYWLRTERWITDDPLYRLLRPLYARWPRLEQFVRKAIWWWIWHDVRREREEVKRRCEQQEKREKA